MYAAMGYLRILMVEPSRSFQAALSVVLEGYRASQSVATSGEEALALCRSEDYDLITCSMHLPDVAAAELCQKVRALPRLTAVPMILLTSSDDDGAHRAALAAGFSAVFAKDAPDTLRAYVRELTDRMNVPRALHARVLMVEDSPTQVQVLRAALEPLELDIVHRETAEEALALVTEEVFDLVMTDFVLKGQMTGAGLLRSIRALPGDRAGTHVLAMTGFDDDARRLELLRLGINDYVRKPVLPEELRLRVTNLIRQKRLKDKVKAQERRLQNLADTDTLTELFNRRYLQSEAPSLLRSVREAQEHVALLVIDVDHFKKVNDTHGHAVGDEVLKVIAERLRASTRAGDIVARVGGEEFVVLLPNCRPEDALRRAEAIRSSVAAEPISGLSVTLSIGAAGLSPEGPPSEYESLFRAADQAVYRAKSEGRNRVVAESAPPPSS